jgi:hypothetical protein
MTFECALGVSNSDRARMATPSEATKAPSTSSRRHLQDMAQVTLCRQQDKGAVATYSLVRIQSPQLIHPV